MRTPRNIVKKRVFEALINDKGMREAKPGVYVTSTGSTVLEVVDDFMIADEEYVAYLDRAISRNNHGYLQVGCKRSCTLVHRLVAAAFVPNPNGYNEVDHKDGDKMNNDFHNLVWTTHSNNMQRAWDNGQIPRTHENKGRYNKKMQILTLPDGTKSHMTFDQYLTWRFENGLRVDNISRSAKEA